MEYHYDDYAYATGTNCCRCPRPNQFQLQQQQPCKTIGTHSGVFHCDEVLACFMLKLLPEYSNAKIIRTRDEQVLKTLDIVVDVGGIYDPTIHRYDHHQGDFNQSISSIQPNKTWTTKLSSAGLVYCHFGHRILSIILNKPEQDEDLKKVYDKVYENFVEEIDATDNGVMVNDAPKKFKVTTTLSSRVGKLNPDWKSENTEATQWNCFEEATKLVGSEFLAVVNYYGNVWLDYYPIVKTAVQGRFDVDPSGEIIHLSVVGPWKEHLVAVETELKIDGVLKFALTSDGGVGGDWKVHAIPVTPDSFQSRLPLKASWRGLSGIKLQEESDIIGAKFVHSTGFIGAGKDKESVLQMAKLTLNDSKGTK